MTLQQGAADRAMVVDQQRRGRDQLLKARDAIAGNERVDLDLVLAGGERETRHTNLEAGGSACRPVAQAPLLLGGQGGQTILAAARLAVIAQHDLLDTPGDKLPRPLRSKDSEPGLPEGRIGEIVGVVRLKRGEGLELGLGDDHRLRPRGDAVPAKGGNGAAWLVRAERAVALLPLVGARAQVDDLSVGDVREDNPPAKVPVSVLTPVGIGDHQARFLRARVACAPAATRLVGPVDTRYGVFETHRPVPLSLFGLLCPKQAAVSARPILLTTTSCPPISGAPSTTVSKTQRALPQSGNDWRMIPARFARDSTTLEAVALPCEHGRLLVDLPTLAANLALNK